MCVFTEQDVPSLSQSNLIGSLWCKEPPGPETLSANALKSGGILDDFLLLPKYVNIRQKPRSKSKSPSILIGLSWCIESFGPETLFANALKNTGILDAFLLITWYVCIYWTGRSKSKCQSFLIGLSWCIESGRRKHCSQMLLKVQQYWTTFYWSHSMCTYSQNHVPSLKVSQFSFDCPGV